MMRSILRVTSFVGIWILVLIAVGALGDYAAPVYPEIKARRAMLEERAVSIEVLSLGASHADALDFDMLGVAGFHLWNSGADFHEMDYLTAEVLEDLPNLRCLFVSLSPYQLDSDNGVQPDRRALRQELYVRTLSATFIDGDLKSFIAGKLAPVVRPDHWRRVANSFRYGRHPAPITEDGSSRIPAHNAVPADSFGPAAQAAAENQAERRRQVLAIRPEAPHTGRAALYRLLERAGDRGLNVILYTAPYHRTYLEAIDSVVLHETRAYGAAMEERLPHVRYADFSADADLGRSPVWYRDPSHLNEEGSVRFSGRLKRDLGGSSCAGTQPANLSE